MKTIPTPILGGPSDGVVFDRPIAQSDGVASDGTTVYRYELDGDGQLVFTGETWLDLEALGCERVEREFAKMLR